MQNIEELRARQDEIVARLKELDNESEGRALTDDAQGEWDSLDAEYDRNEKAIAAYESRQDRMRSMSARSESREDEPVAAPQRTRKSHVPDDPTDLDGYRMRATSYEDLSRSLTEGARRLVEDAVFADERADEDATKARLERLLKKGDTEDRELARRIIGTSSETYERAFGKSLLYKPLTAEEQRALSLTTTAGGYAVPVVLDPTVILTSDGYEAPIRSLARVETIVGNTWQGVSSAGITASYGAEATEASDNAPTLAQPSANVEKAQAFVPYSIEIGQDWASMQSEIARMLADAKGDLESYQFLHGLGHSSTAPEGLLVGATYAYTTAATATFAVADLYGLINALPPRWRRRAQFAGNRAAYDKIRQFDSSGGASLWVQLAFNQPSNLVGFPAHEWSDYVSTTTTSGSTLMTIGDFSQFLIVDRVGMNVELVPHLFATANNRPSGQRGLYAYWRNTSDVLVATAFRHLKLL